MLPSSDYVFMSTLLLFQTNCALISHIYDKHGLIVIDSKTLICGRNVSRQNRPHITVPQEKCRCGELHTRFVVRWDGGMLELLLCRGTFLAQKYRSGEIHPRFAVRRDRGPARVALMHAYEK
jgi:hypothetical protein